MEWNLEGLEIEGLYLGEIPVKGRVNLSRVAFGGGVQHHVILSKPTTIYGEKRLSAIVEHRFITRVLGSA